MISNEVVNPTLDFRCQFQYWIAKLCWFVIKPNNLYQIPMLFLKMRTGNIQINVGILLLPITGKLEYISNVACCRFFLEI